jgi:YD repeat-containing protein
MYAASRAIARIHLISLLVTYALTVSLFAPFTAERVQASAETDSGGKENAPSNGRANRELSLNPSTPVSGQRLGVIDAPAENLPDLNVARSRPRHEPRAVLPIPSTRRRCPPHNRRCNDDIDGLSAPTPTPPPLPTPAPLPSGAPLPMLGGHRNPHSLASLTARSLLGMLRAAMNGGSPVMEIPLLHYYTGEGGYSVSDAPATVGIVPADMSLAVSRAIVTSAPGPLVQAGGLVAHWTFDENTGTTTADFSGNGNSGTLVSGAAWGAGPNGSAVSLDGVNDYVQVGAQSSLVMSSAASLSAWIYPTGAGSEPTYGGVIINKEGEYQIVRFPDGSIQWSFANSNPGWNFINTGYVAPLNQWTHVAVVYESGVVKTYINGTLTHTYTGTGAIGDVNNTQNEFRVGGRQAISQTFQGRIDEVRVYNRALSVQEVMTLPGEIGTGLTAEYYDNLDFSSYKLTRTDATVNFDWANGAPDPSVGADEFSVRWTGMVVPRYSETYTFYTTSDDGVRLWVDGNLVVDKWIDQGATEWSGQLPFPLTAGRAYSIKMEFYERFGGAMAKLQWSSASQLKEVIPQTQLYGCWKSSDQFTRDFHVGALARQPYAGELQDWSNQLTQAQGDSQLVAVAQALGANVFNSPEYAARNRSDYDYVGDVYWAYLQRPPDQAGWDFWTNQIAACGADAQCRATQRANVRVAFDQSGEFQEKVRRLCGTSAAAPDNGGVGYNFSTARLDPSNRTGGGGADPLSRNYNWALPILGLPGRAGLDLNLTLSHNSLVWTKDSTGVTFDADPGFPGPGFRLGFPSIQPKFFNPQTGKYAYLLVTPSGGHIELRQVGVSNVYESADSSYLQLTEGGALTLLTTDGTRLSLWLISGEYRCTEVKDRNGNYLSVAYYGDGRIDKVIDTLGRTVTFNYDTYQNLISITQPWKRQTEANPTGVDEVHTWATFGYTNLTLQPSFSSLAVMGEQPGTIIPVITQVGLGDGSYYKLSYNGWGQVWKVTHFAADSVVGGVPQDTHALSHTRLNLPGSDLLGASPQTDCPRFTELRTWVENGVMNQSAEVTTSYSTWTPNMASCDVTVADGTAYKELYATSGWQKGLTTQSEVRSLGELKKWTTLSWTQDDTNAVYKINPRVNDATVNDSGNNHRRTSVTFTSFGLPQEVTEYAANATTPLRTTRTEYGIPNLGEYNSRRIIGLPSFQFLYEGTSASGTLLSKVEYVYDDVTLPEGYLNALPSAATQHDGPNYGTGLRWRGNANRVRRYDVTGGAGTYVESQASYNITGTVAFSKDVAGHKVSVSYGDAFYQGVNRSNPVLQTFAYPTTVTNPDLFTASTWYNYDMGVVTESETPLPNVTSDQQGPQAEAPVRLGWEGHTVDQQL